jgi:carbonic anhydrase
MCDQHHHSLRCNHLRRRSFLKALGLAPTVGAFGSSLIPDTAHADALTKAQRDKMSPSEIIAVAKRGNERFRSGVRKNRNFLNEQKASASGQYPAAVLVSCIDSRAPAEVIMDLGLGDIFNCRVAGNITNQDILGSMEFACKLAGAKVVLVMGHTACGAIKGAIDNVELGNLTGLLDKIKPAVQATSYSGERSSKNSAFVDAVARTNVQMTVDNVRKNSAVLAELERNGTIKIVGAMYNIQTAALEFLS